MADILFIQGNVGAGTGNNGDSKGLTLTRNLALRVAQNQSAFQEAVLRGSCFAVANQTGVASQAGLSATTPVLTLANPAGSGVNCVLWYANCIQMVAAAAAAAVWVAANTNLVAAAVTGTLTTTHRNLLLGGGQPKVVPLLAATLPAAPVAIANLGALLTGAITTVPGVYPLERWFNGAIVISPGAAISIQTSTASGASGLLCEYIWEEASI